MGSVRNPHLEINRGLVGDWPMWEGSGGQVFDLSGNNSTGTFAAGAASPIWVPGKFGITTSYDGGDSIDLGNPAQLTFGATDSFTVFCRFRATQNTDQRAFYKFVGGGDVIGIANSVSTAGKASFVIRDDDEVGLNILEGTSNTSDGEWHDVFGVRDVSRDLLLIYVDGVEENNTQDDTIGGFSKANSKWAFGKAGAENVAFWNGDIDTGMIWNRALSSGEVALLHQEPFCGFRWTSIIELASYIAAVGGIPILHRRRAG